MAPSTPFDPATAGQQSRSSTVQGLLSLALLAHMFIVLVVVASNSSDAQIYARLRRALFFVLPYVQILHLDTAYTFNLTDGPPTEPDHDVQIEVRRGRDDAGKRRGQPGEGELEETVLLADPSIVPRHRRVRYLRLSRFLAGRIGGTSEAVLPEAIAREVLSKRGKQYDAVVICRQQQHTGGPEQAGGPFDPMDYQETYRGVAWYTIQKTLAYKKVEQKGRTAQPDAPSKTPPKKPKPTPPPTIDPATIPPPAKAGPQLP